MKLQGELFIYDEQKKLVAFDSGNAKSNLCFILIGGLSDGFLTLPFTESLSAYANSISASFVQILLTSSYHGFGHASVIQDAEELSQCIKFLHWERQDCKFVLIGHSTGCQDIVYYLNHVWNDKVPIIGCILQAGVSDRDYFYSANSNSLEFLKLAKDMIDTGKSEEMMPRDAELLKGIPITASRYYSLLSHHGLEDFFSFDLDYEYQKQFFSKPVPLTVVLSGKDEYVPKPVFELAAKYRKFDQIIHVDVINDADHSISNQNDQQLNPKPWPDLKTPVMANTLIDSKTVKTSSLHSPLPFAKRLYVWPFALLYLIWLYIFIDNQIFQHEELYVLVLGLLTMTNIITALSCFWSVSADAFLSCSIENDPFKAKFIKVLPVMHRGNGQLALLQKDKMANGEIVLSFTFQKKKFIYDENKKKFRKLDVSCNLAVSVLKDESGLNEAKVKEVELMYGLNKFDIPLPTFTELFKEHAVAPFFVFQLFCVGLWLLDEFWYYSLFTLFMLLVFESTVVQQRIRNLIEFRTMSIKPTNLNVKRNGKWSLMSSDLLLPNDLCSIVYKDEEFSVPCDLLLIDGSCIVNEAMLSGESTPLLKEFLQKEEREHLNINLDKSSILFGGTTLLQTNPSSKTPDNGCLVRVLRTGFHTQQGKLIRTMIFSTERITANNLESLLFILFLLMFAIAAAIYVWIKGIEDEERNKYKLLLECVLIVTAVVPPELPMELSLAVNTALLALSKFAIFCTEPFRIPFAGKIDVCCFDKTGTLTDERLVVEGLAGIRSDNPLAIVKDSAEAAYVIASCHSLLLLNNSVVGDPMEQAALEFVNWKLERNDVVASKKERLKILKKFPFSSALKRMSVVYSVNGKFMASVKGAPETILGMLKVVPSWYESVFQDFAIKGSRIIALAYKDLGSMNRELSRDELECDLIFAGFLVFHCPMKAHSKDAIKMLQESSHKTLMITGDNHLTAIHVAKELEMIKNVINIELLDDNILHLQSIGISEVNKKLAVGSDLEIDNKKYDISVTGLAIDVILTKYTYLLPFITVYARASPSQKELILTSQKEFGFTTLMCGDGTNDVGALKQAHVGVALLDGKPEDLNKILKQARNEMLRKKQEEMKKAREDIAKRFGSRMPPVDNTASFLEDEMEAPMVKLGDASVAAPFTSKISTIDSVCNIIRQGRCTLVTTIQMYKILALNSLISAYSLSVLHLDGIRYGDFQVTVTGMLLAGCFLFLSKSSPVKELDKKRPHPNIFNPYIIFSVLIQFAIHVASLVYVVFYAKRLIFIRKLEELKFEPNLLNSAIFLLSLSMQVSTFVVNYQGKPFRESLLENKPLRNALAIVGSVAFICALEIFPDFNEWLELVVFPQTFKLQLFFTMLLDFALCWLVEVVCFYLFANSKSKMEKYRN